ncbi:MAG TPA: hypothetical protein VJZ27_12225, partial [Aggregatilineales bacterium]|nr:hypothetical protein [Aggregatilineales bacterium]
MNGEAPNLTALADIVQPADTFRDVFASEGRVAFRVGRRQVEATSHAIPAETGRRMVVVMRELNRPGGEDTGYDPVQAMSMVGEISAMLAQSSDLQETLNSILHSISGVIECDSSEVNLWEEDETALRPIAQSGDAAYISSLKDHGSRYRLDEGFTGWLARYRQPVVIGDVSTRQDMKPKLSRFPFS